MVLVDSFELIQSHLMMAYQYLRTAHHNMYPYEVLRIIKTSNSRSITDTVKNTFTYIEQFVKFFDHHQLVQYYT